MREALHDFNEIEDLDSELFNSELEKFLENVENYNSKTFAKLSLTHSTCFSYVD